jgi:predicted phosphodiesterase
VDPSTHHALFGHYLTKLDTDLIGLGHTHVPFVWDEGGKTVFNPGSVGQPRDADWRASYAILSVEGHEIKVEIRRVEYDVKKAASKIRAAGLPESHAARLAMGT